MKKTILLLFICFIYTSSFAQIEKGNWLVGGSGSFSSSKFKDTTPEYKTTLLELAPDFGYFLFRKIAIGLSPHFNYSSNKFYNNPSYINTSSSYYSIGPFARYYLLSYERHVNVFSEINYQIFKNNHNYFSFSGGPVIFIRESVGLELKISYSKIESNNRTITTGLGFQIHLKNK